MKSLRAWFATRTGRLVLHDGGLALGTGVAAWDAAGHSLTWGAAVAAAFVAAKAFLRLILPVPPAPKVAPAVKPSDAGYALIELLVAAVLLVLFVWLVVSVVGR